MEKLLFRVVDFRKTSYGCEFQKKNKLQLDCSKNIVLWKEIKLYTILPYSPIITIVNGKVKLIKKKNDNEKELEI